MDTVIDVYAILVGCLIFVMWGTSLAMGKVPELATTPWAIRFHISAESLMGVTLVGGGLAALAGVTPGPAVVALGLGMTLYSIVNSSGYYAERRELPPLVMFAVLFVVTILAACAQVAAIAA